MLRLSELALFLSPFLLFGVWRVAAAYGLPPSLVAGAAAALLAMLAAVIWLSAERALPLGVAYVPARLVDGRVVPGHAGDVVPGHAGDVVPGHAGDVVPGHAE